MTFQELLSEMDRIETDFKNAGFGLIRKFKQEDYYCSLETAFNFFKDGSTGNSLDLFEYRTKILNMIDVYFKINAWNYDVTVPFKDRTEEKSNEVIVNTVEVSMKLDNVLNELIKDFKDMTIEIVDAEAYGGIWLLGGHCEHNLIKSPADLKQYLKRTTDLAKHLKEIFKIGE